MKNSLLTAGAILILSGFQFSLAQETTSTPVVSDATVVATPTVKHHKKKKKSLQATPTVEVTVLITVSPTVSPSSMTKMMFYKPTATPTAVPETVSLGAINSSKIYDRMNMPGDFRKALSLAVETLNSDSAKYPHTVFLALDKVSSNRDDKQKRDAYVRFAVHEMEFGGPRNAWILLAGTVYEQAGGDCKVGDPIELAIDFKDIKIDYDGNKLGEIQKGNDIAAQVYEALENHGTSELILEAKDQVKDVKYHDDMASYIAKAREGYSILDLLNVTHESSH